MNIIMHYYIFHKVTRKNKVDFLEGFLSGKKIACFILIVDDNRAFQRTSSLTIAL